MGPAQNRRTTAQGDPDLRMLQALADPNRLAMIRQLGSGQICACDLTSCCDVSQPTVSHHLKVLREAGLVQSDRRGTWVYYRLTGDAASRLRRLAETLTPTASAASDVAPSNVTGRELPGPQSGLNGPREVGEAGGPSGFVAVLD